MTPDFVGRCEEDQLKLEVERLKKELENTFVLLEKAKLQITIMEDSDPFRLGTNRGYSWGFDKGLVEGERRAMVKVKETLLRLDKNFSKGAFPPTFRTLYRELGLGEDKDTGNGSYPKVR